LPTPSLHSQALLPTPPLFSSGLLPTPAPGLLPTPSPYVRPFTVSPPSTPDKKPVVILPPPVISHSTNSSKSIENKVSAFDTVLPKVPSPIPKVVKHLDFVAPWEQDIPNGIDCSLLFFIVFEIMKIFTIICVCHFFFFFC
jgi:hypothetical protein